MGPTPDNQVPTTPLKAGALTTPANATAPDSTQDIGARPSMPRAEPTNETADQMRNGAAIPPSRPASATYSQNVARPNDVMAQAFEALYGPRGGRLAIDGYIDPDRVANNIYNHAINHDLSVRDLDDVINLEPTRNPDKWNRFQQALRAKTGMSGDVSEILYSINANQMEFQRRQYSSTAPINLSFMIDRISPTSLAPAPIAHELTLALHNPDVPESQRRDNFVNGAMAVTPAERPAVKEEMKRDAKLVAGAFEVLQRELSPQNANPNFIAVFKAINGLNPEKMQLIEQRYDEKAVGPHLRERIAQLGQEPGNEQQTNDLLHMLDRGFDSTWVAEEIIGTVGHSAQVGDDWTLGEPRKKRITWLLERLTESQMQQVAEQVSSPLARDICNRFTIGSQRQEALALLSDDGIVSSAPSQPQTSEYPADVLISLNNALHDGDYALLEKTLSPLNIAQKIKLVDDYNSSHQTGVTLGAVQARLGRPVGAGAENDPILHPPEMRANVAPKDIGNVDDISQLWLEVEGFSAEREQTVRHGRPFTKQKSMRNFTGWTDEDYDAVVRLAASLGPNGVPPAALMAVFQIESHGGDPTDTNPLNGAAGVFQLTKENQKLLGFRGGEVQSMSVADQINEIGPAYFRDHGGSAIRNSDDVYEAIFIGNPDNNGERTPLFKFGQSAYTFNAIYDHNADGTITLGESLTKFRHALRRINSDENIMSRLGAAHNRVFEGQLASN